MVAIAGKQTLAKISKRPVDALRPDQARDTFLWDDAIPGFGVRCRPSGRKIYLLKYRAGRRQRWLTLGAHGVITADQARARALRHKADIGDGVDPSGEKQERRREPTIADLADRYLAEHVDVHNKLSTQAEMRRLVNVRIKPALGAKRITELNRPDVAKWHHAMAATPYEGNRALACLSKMLNLAATMWELRPDNPCKGIRRFPERVHDRHLDENELQRLGEALAAAEEDGSERPETICIIRLLAATGMRLGEACGLAWDDVDLKARTIRLRDAKAGPRTVQLGAAAVAVLAAAPDRDGYLASAALDPEKPISPAASSMYGPDCEDGPGSRACACMTCDIPSAPSPRSAARMRSSSAICSDTEPSR